MKNLKTFNDLYDDLFEISQVDTCSCNKKRDEELAKLLIKFKIKLNGSITPVLEEYIKEYPLLNYYSLGRDILKNTSLDKNKKTELGCKFFKTDTISKSMVRRLEHQLMED